ncbi:uncharacterized protein V6R79_000067 [Siganus canaliculatus]
MFCPKCGEEWQKPFKFCPECGAKFLVSIERKAAEGVATSASQPSAVVEEKNQTENPNQIPKDVTEDQGKTGQKEGQRTSDNSVPTSNAPLHSSDNTGDQAALEQEVTSSSLSSTLSGAGSITCKKSNVPKTFKEDERLSATPTILKQPVSTTSCSSTPASDAVTEQILSALSATPVQEADLTAPESSEQAPLKSDLAKQQSVSKQDEDGTSDGSQSVRHESIPQNLSEKSDIQIPTEDGDSSSSAIQQLSVLSSVSAEETKVTETEKEQEKLSASENDSQSHNESVPGSVSTIKTPHDQLSEGHTLAPADIHVEISPNKAEAPADRESDSYPGCLMASVPSQESDRKEDQTVQHQRFISEEPVTKKAEDCADPGPATEEAAKSAEDPDTKPNQEPLDGEVISDESSWVDLSHHGGVNIIEASTPLQAPQSWPNTEYITVCFHAVTSKQVDLQTDHIFLMSGKLFGNWERGLEMSPSRHVGENRYLVRGQYQIPKNLIHESIPYKYLIVRYIEKNHYNRQYEQLYHKDGKVVDRSLKIKEEHLTREGEWHQYDDMIHLDLNTGFFKSTKDVVIKHRDLAGREMLNLIFDLLTTWNKANVDNFFFLLQQFYYTYSFPAVHDGKEDWSGLKYSSKEVENLIRAALTDNILSKSKTSTTNLTPLHAGMICLLIYNKYLKDDMTDQLSLLCELLCLPNKVVHHFKQFWEDFASPLANQKRVAEAVEMLCSNARQKHIDKWVLVIPLVHLLRGDSKPFEPVKPVFNPQFAAWTGLKESKQSHLSGEVIQIMKKHAYLADIDRLLVHSWMSLLRVADLSDFIVPVNVEILDILYYTDFKSNQIKSEMPYKALKDLASALINRVRHKRFDEENGKCCLQTSAMLLATICRRMTDPLHCDVPLDYLELVCLITRAYDHKDESGERILEESIGNVLVTVPEWQRSTFKNKLLHRNTGQFFQPIEVKVWQKLLSLSFGHKELTSSWKTTFTEDFKRKLKREHPVNQIGIYTTEMEEMRQTSPLLSDAMEKCALEAMDTICQDKSGRSLSDLLKKHDITKFGKLISVVVLKTWPTDEYGHRIEAEDSIFEYLLNWPFSKTVFQMTGREEGLIGKMSEEAQGRMTLAGSAFRSVSKKFLSGEIQIKTLKLIFQQEQEFLNLLKTDGLHDDGRCKDDTSMKALIRQRHYEVEAVRHDRELVKGLLQICQNKPEHVRVDFEGLDEQFNQDIEAMNLNEFMIVHTLGEVTSSTVGQVTYFNLSDNTRQMALDLHTIKDSTIFKMLWTNQVEVLSRDQPDPDESQHLDGNEEIYTLDLVYSQIFQTCYSKYKELYGGLKSGKLLLEQVDTILESYKEDQKLQSELDIMCRTDSSDDRQWIQERILQIQHYRGLHLALESAEIIMDIRKTICPLGDFGVLEKMKNLNQTDLKKSTLDCIDTTLIKTKDILMGISDEHRGCLLALSQSKEFVLWVKEALKELSELKVFVDLASIFAGESDQDVDRVAYFHDAVLGYSSVLFGLEQDSDFEAFQGSLSNLWKALRSDEAIPTKLRDTARQLDWFKTVKESHGSVEFSSLSLATAINERGMYIIKAQNQIKINLETCLTLEIQDGSEKNMACTYEDLKELQNKLMLMSGRKEQNQTEVECFTEVFDSVQRLVRVFVDLYAAGNPLFRCWEAKVYCNSQSDPCITMEIDFCKNLHHINICGSLVEQLALLSKKMELFLKDWQNFMNQQRSSHYYLNYFTAEQIFYLSSAMTPQNLDVEIEDKALMMLSFVKPNCTSSDVLSTWGKFNEQFMSGKSINEDVPFESHFLRQDDGNFSSAHCTEDDPDSTADQTVGLKELEELWNNYMKNDEMFFHDLLDIRSLGTLLKMMTVTENQNEDEWEELMPSKIEFNVLKRELPKSLVPNQPNVIICPHDDVLSASICLYMTNEYDQLPSYDEVLLCSHTTSVEQVELFLRRCLTPGDTGQKIYTMLWADQLTYEVSCAMEECFQKLRDKLNHNYRLVIFCSSDGEHTYIPTAFSQFKKDFVPQERLEKIRTYLSRHYTVTRDHKNAGFKGGHSVGIIASRRAGVGKSLYIQRLFEKLEKSVEQGTPMKKCIRLTETEVDDHKLLQCLYDTTNHKGIRVFHFDVTSSVKKGVDEFLFKLFFLRYLMDSEGQMWHCSDKDWYIVELLESTDYQPRHALRSGEKGNFAFSDIFPKVYCHPPKEIVALEIRREENPDMDIDDPLMDDEWFQSEAYQRPYQYLTRFKDKSNLDTFTYQGVEGTHAECLQILLFYCGIVDPSWVELRNFVWFLNLQLKDCENSDFCKLELVGDTLFGFKNFVVKFMILMSKDFATPSLCISDQSPGRQQVDMSGLNERDLAPFLIRKRWESEPHPYIFFNSDHTSMTFIGFHLKANNHRGIDAINPVTQEVIESDIMTQALYNGLRHQGVPFNRNPDKIPRAEKIQYLCNVLGIRTAKDPDKTYELTTDNILKMMAIHMKFRCGIPVIIMGETGCGKTRLVKFMCDLQKSQAPAENMKLVKVHGGTTSEMIYEKVKTAEALARINKENHGLDSVLFFDEANTSEAISAIKEVVCDKSVQGQDLDSGTGLHLVSACNPYRKHTDEMIERLEASGLGYRVRAEETDDRLGSIPLRQLVYRVHALPPSMIPLVWDFGQLNDTTEKMYIEQIVQRQLKTNLIDMNHFKMITQVLSSSQKFMRERKDECSFVSLRDVERCMDVFVWFYKNHSMFAEELSKMNNPTENNESMFVPAGDRVVWSLLMAAGVCYQSCLEDKKPYWITISQWLPEHDVKRIMQEIQLMQNLLLSGVRMGQTIARNEALKENFFMMVICVELRIPLFIVGKPGSSKSLSKTLVADAMQGPASYSELYKRLKQIHLVSFQCSPHSTPEGIISTFKLCARFQEHKNLDEYISVVVLDEIGLAEDSQKMPLKTLHPLLEEGCVDDEPEPHKRVGFIGISNWALDPAKMNRGIFVSRGDPNKKELIKSAEGICSSDAVVLQKIRHLFEPFAKAYMTICQEGAGFFGLRDFYSLIKMVFSITKMSNEIPTANEITGAVLRNFSGRDDVDVMGIFSKELRDDFANATITTNDLVHQSLSPASQEDESRYLLILTKNYAALQILQQIFLSHSVPPEIIFGSSFPKDQEYSQICRNISRVKVCMETGRRVVLLNLQNLYESLYDALNQYYVTFGGQKYVDLGLGTHRVKCRVHKNFRLIVIEEKEVVYKQFPIPLINRLEKHYLDINTVLTNEQKDIAKQLQEWVVDFTTLNNQPLEYVPKDVFIGYHFDTCSSVVLQVAQSESAETDAQTILDKAKDLMLKCATPDSVVRLDNSKLPVDEREYLMKEYVKEEMHRSIGDYIVYHTQQQDQCHFFTEVTTFSRLLTAVDIQLLKNMTKHDNVKLLSLQQFDTESSFLKRIREFLGSTTADKVLIVQTDYDEGSRRNILSSAKYSCLNEINKWATTDSVKTFVYFVIKLPRIQGGTSYVGFQGDPWRSVHIDDLRRSSKFLSDVRSWKNVRISDLFQEPPPDIETEEHTDVPKEDDSTVCKSLFDTTDLIRSCVQSAVSMLRDSADSGELSTDRVENLLALLDQGVFASILRKRLQLLLQEYEANTFRPENWVQKVASSISALQEGGTFLHTLWRKIQAVVTPLLATLVSVIDRDCNLDLLLEKNDDITKLWLEIFAKKEMLQVPFVRVDNNSSVLMVQSHTVGGSTMRCHMPFSWWIKDFLDELMMQTSRHEKCSPSHFKELFLNMPLGVYLTNNVNDRLKKEFYERYLQDFVSMTLKVASDEELQLLCEALTSYVDEMRRRKRDEDELSLPHLHIAHHFCQSRLQNLSRMLSLHPDIIPLLRKGHNDRHYPEMVLDVCAALACVERLESPNLDTDAHSQLWLKQVKNLQTSVELICSQHFNNTFGQRCKETFRAVSGGWKRIHIMSLFVEHMLLGFHDDEKQLRAMVHRKIQTLAKILEEHCDVKSVEAFEAVITILKSCKESATHQFFRFGLQCAVCLTEPQDPVKVPCDHIFCSTCLEETRAAGTNSCPTCRQQIPDDFQPCVSEELRASLKKNARFRQRCNGFFIDLLSTVCFKDNTPPARGVINHLLSYLMIETGHEQIQTKDLSPFDESPDKNPVVRSVILKLLLKFSFGEVEEYLQQHLSSVEDSRVVDEVDKAELYALYINCLEDSMWEQIPDENKAVTMKTFYTNGTQFLRGFLAESSSAPDTVSIQHLQHIAQLRLSLTVAAQLIGDRMSGNTVPSGARDFLNMVVGLCEDSRNDWYRVYLIRKLSDSQGIELVQTLVKQPQYRWLFPAEIQRQHQDGGQMDQFLVYGEEYKAVRDAVEKAVVDGDVGGDVENIEEVCKSCTVPPRNRTVFLLLALFREVTTLYRSENESLHPTPERCEAFGELIQGSEYLHQQKLRHFASALVHNRLGALSITPDRSVMHNAFTELIVHLAAVLLTTNSPLLMPLKHLGLSPETMQRAFIPTMPDDMLAVAQAVLQQNAWGATLYVCPNNHPCFVGECGRPMERGECPECHLPIGGEHHNPVDGFQRIDGQQDGTRPGHILGDPEQRKSPGALDTKNMSLTPFTLVRLVTHLAMLWGTSDKPQSIQQIIQPPVEDVSSFLTEHITADLDQLSQALGKGFDDIITAVHLVLRSLQTRVPASPPGIDPHLSTKVSRNSWETTVSTDIMTPQLKDLDQHLQEAKGRIRADPRVSTDLIVMTISSEDCSFLKHLAQGSQIHSSAVWSCRKRLSLFSLTHIVEQQDQKEELPLLWKFLQKEREFQHIRFLPDILILQKRLVRKFQNASDQTLGSISEFIEKQPEMRVWYEKQINIFLNTWNLLRVSVASNEFKIPDEFYDHDLDLNSDLQYLLPRRQGPGLCATGLVSYLVSLHNELVNAVESYTGEDNSGYKVSLAELTEQHVICYDVGKDLLPLVLSNCQYSLERGHETISQYDLPRIQRQILTRFLQGKPQITRTGIPTLVNTQERDYESVFRALKEKVAQVPLSSLTRNALSRELDSYSEVCEALKIVELLLGFLLKTGGDPKMSLVSYLQDILKMADNIDQHILKALGRCRLNHCVCLWQLLCSLKSENMLRLKREPFSGYAAEYQSPLTEEQKIELKGFVSRGNVDQWLLELHEFILLSLGHPRSTKDYRPTWSVIDCVVAYMERKEAEVPRYVEEKFPPDLQLSHIIEIWKYAVTAKQELMMEA